MKKNDPKTTKILFGIFIALALICLAVMFIYTIKGSGNNEGGKKATEKPYITEEPKNTPENTGEEDVTPAPTQGTQTPTPGNTPEPTKAPTPTPDKDRKPVSSVSMLAAGDNLLHNAIIKEAGEKGNLIGRDYDFDYIYENVKGEIGAADISIINQESLILPKRYFGNKLTQYVRSDGSFVTPSEMTDTLIKIGFDVMCKANNHMLDMGSGGMKWGIDYMSTVSEMLAVGAYYDEADSRNIRILEKNGIKIAFLGYTYDTNVPQWKASWEAPEFPYYIPLLDEEKMISDLKAANEAADFTVVTVHWGTEYQEKANDEQRRIAKILAENGAGIIIGHHCHCLQEIEYVDDGRGGKVLCAYSLGTLVSNMSGEKNMLAGFLKFNLTKWSDGTVTVSDEKFVPTVFYYDKEYKNNKLYYFSQMTDDLCGSHGIGNYPKDKEVKNKMTIETMREYLEKTIDKKFIEIK